MGTDEHGVVLFDGVCNLCNGAVNFLLDRDTNDRLRFGSLQSEAGENLLNRYSIDRKTTDSIVFIDNSSAFTYSTAALKIAKQTGRDLVCCLCINSDSRIHKGSGV